MGDREYRPNTSKKQRLRLVALVACVLVVVAVIAAVGTGRQAPAPSIQNEAGSVSTVARQSVESPLETQGNSAEQAQDENPANNEETRYEVISDGSDGISLAHDARTVLVKLADGATAADLNAALESADYVRTTDIAEGDVMLGYVELLLSPSVSVPEAMTRLEALPSVQASQPNFVYEIEHDSSLDLVAGSFGDEDNAPELEEHAIVKPNDNGVVQDLQWALDSINAYEAWGTVQSDGRVTIAIIDKLCVDSHDDIYGNVVNTINLTNDKTLSSTDHATHVAGIASAVTNNNLGVAGTSYNARLLPIQVFRGPNASTSTLLAAYRELIETGPAYNVRVVNMSLGVMADDEDELAELDDGLHDAVQTARTQCGILTVCSVGNNADDSVSSNPSELRGPYLNFPSDGLYDCALTVMALKQGESDVSRASYSNYNTSTEVRKEIAAPGSDILSARWDSDQGSIYATLSGTSMASPCVAGVAALLFSADPSLTPDDVERIICKTAKKVGDADSYTTRTGASYGTFSSEYGYGEVDAAAAVAAVGRFLDGESHLLASNRTTDANQTTSTFVPKGFTSAEGTYTWASSDPSVASVSESGIVTAGTTGGTTTITATFAYDDNGTAKTESASRNVTVYDAYLSNKKGLVSVPVGEYLTLDLHEDPSTGMWVTASADKSIAQVNVEDDGTLLVEGKSVGETYITETLAANTDVVLRYSIQVTAERAIFSDIVSVSISGWTFDGATHEPTPTVTLKSDGSTVDPSLYSVYGYSGNTNAGTCTVLVQPAGAFADSYKGIASGTCTVERRSVSGASVSAMGPYTYTGTALEPTPSVRVDGRLLTRGTDYTLSYENNVNVGSATVKIKGRGNYTGSETATFSITAPPEPDPEPDPVPDPESEPPVTVPSHVMHRLYNPNSGEHFYTSSDFERDVLVEAGWNAEGDGWTSPATSNTPVYRLYNPNAGDHHYTTSALERDHLASVGWHDEGIGWYSDDSERQALYRLYNPNAVAGAHHYTTNTAERDYLASIGWHDEGIGWYGIVS